MVWCGMRNASHQNAWVAAFLAILLKVMALPMASALGTLSLEQWLAGSFCSSGGVQPILVTLDKDPSSSTVQGEQGHCCCAQSIGAAPLGSSSLALVDALGVALRLPTTLLFLPAVRDRWPSLNPRASPARCN
ncbi:DUF2946 domain-containing protein [Pseudomonas sp. LD120]|nr:DUF2946 domain-containing protein [Pseudomonas sp. LD120]